MDALVKISVAAQLVGVHPQTLRVWEARGVLVPARSAGGTRLYCRADLERLARLLALVEEGVNWAGAVRIIALEDEIRHLRG